MARVLVTRPVDAAAGTVARATALGHEVMLAPVLAIAPVMEPAPPAGPLQALLVTSRHAAPAAADHKASLPVFAVGEGTAAALRRAGAAPTAVAEGDGPSLARLVAARCRPQAGALGHPTGEVRAAGLEAALAAAGFAYRPWVVYRAEPVPDLPCDVKGALGQGGLDAVTLHSPRSARLLVERLRAAGLERSAGGLVVLALSANVAAAAEALRWRAVRVAPRPDECGMGALLEALGH